MERACCTAAERLRWLELRLHQLRLGRQVLMELLVRSEERRRHEVRRLEARLGRLRRHLRRLEAELAAARRALLAWEAGGREGTAPGP